MGAVGEDAGELAGIGRTGVHVSAHCDVQFDVLVDFSLPRGTRQWIDICTRSQRPIVIGTTGHRDDELRHIREASDRIAVLKAPNMSLGVNVLLRLARQLGAVLDVAYDVEITETHHRFKVDAPSGTALALRDAVTRGRESAGSKEWTFTYGRHGETGQRPAGEIGIHSLRSGDTVGKHTVSFGTLGERISVTHEAHSRDTFAVGALRAAKWIVTRPPGQYQMQDVLFEGGAGA
jgi:4-hydroxy-tetrahydrodipicolinate reductase